MGTTTPNKERTVLNRILNLSRLQFSNFGTHIRRYGEDIIRTHLAFRDQEVEGVDVDEAEIEQTQQWLESIWKAVSLVHDSYIITQRCADAPNVPEALYEPGLTSWTDYLGTEHLQWVQVPPEEPDVPDLSADGDEHRLWLISQRAILSYTLPITVRNSLQTVRSHLMRLTKAIVAYDDGPTVSCNMHYYSARILLSLLAPSAPSFAEECWVLLHYGYQDHRGDGDQPRHGINEEEIEEIEEIEKSIQETEDELDRHNLPRQGRPDTLQSIFDQPFPVTKRGTPSHIWDQRRRLRRRC
jgi:leucyl-tRNA synthetase